MRLTITHQHMRAAHRNLQQRPRWPASFTAAMADPLLQRVMRVEAVRLALLEARAPRTNPTTAAAARTAAGSTARPTRAPAFDARRAAANDLEKDHDATTSPSP